MSLAVVIEAGAWVGAALMCVAPFMIDTAIGKMIAMLGLTLLNFQAAEKDCKNLMILNSVGILGYSYALYF